MLGHNQSNSDAGIAKLSIYRNSNLYEIAMDYLPILATSIPSERLFWKAGQIIAKRRNRLSGKHLNVLLFLSSIHLETWRG